MDIVVILFLFISGVAFALCWILKIEELGYIGLMLGVAGITVQTLNDHISLDTEVNKTIKQQRNVKNMITTEELKELSFYIALDDEYMLVAYYDTVLGEIEVCYSRTYCSECNSWEEELWFLGLTVRGKGEFLTKDEVSDLIYNLN